MIVRTLADVQRAGGFAEKAGVWSSVRYLLQSDDVGFTLIMTTVSDGQCLELEYKNHIEANLIIDGKASLTDIETDESYELGPGQMYALDKHDRHRLEALSDLQIVCVFLPALTGSETHDSSGSYMACE